jgi:hypothetical protein
MPIYIIEKWLSKLLQAKFPKKNKYDTRVRVQKNRLPSGHRAGCRWRRSASPVVNPGQLLHNHLTDLSPLHRPQTDNTMPCPEQDSKTLEIRSSCGRWRQGDGRSSRSGRMVRTTGGGVGGALGWRQLWEDTWRAAPITALLLATGWVGVGRGMRMRERWKPREIWDVGWKSNGGKRGDGLKF